MATTEFVSASIAVVTTDSGEQYFDVLFTGGKYAGSRTRVPLPSRDSLDEQIKAGRWLIDLADLVMEK